MCLSGWAHIYTIVEGNRCSLELFVSCMFVFGCLFNAFAFLGFALRCHSHCALLTSFLLTNRLTDWLIDWLIDWLMLFSLSWTTTSGVYSTSSRSYCSSVSSCSTCLSGSSSRTSTSVERLRNVRRRHDELSNTPRNSTANERVRIGFRYSCAEIKKIRKSHLWNHEHSVTKIECQ